MANVTILMSQTLDAINDKDYATIMVFFTCLGIAVATCGLVGTVLSIKTFIMMGLEDGMTTTFLVLSLAEFGYSASCMGMSVAAAFHCVELLNSGITFRVDPFSLTIYFSNICIMLHIIIQLVTTFLAVVRCLCVVRPIHFKNAFPKARCVAILVLFVTFSGASYTPLFASMAIVTQYNSRLNVTRPSLWLAPNRKLIKDIIWTIEDATIPFCTEFIVIVCLILMADGLRRAAKFRMSTSKLTKMSSANGSERVSGKELLIIRQVALISGCYMLANTPKVASNLVCLVIPEYTLDGRYNNLYLVIFNFRKFFETFNCSISWPIYYECNPKFRSLS